jgi:hypothetical protein
MSNLYSILLKWGENDEGYYGICVEAENEDDATRQARGAMHDAMEYDDPEDPEVREYEVIEIHKGANIWAAPEMLTALTELLAANRAVVRAFADRRERGEALARRELAEGDAHDAIRAGRGTAL